jgi:hypothetical protein
MNGGRPAKMDAREALVETFAYYKYEVTRFEADLWSRIIDEHGDEAMLAFLQTHLRTSQFAPKISDAQRLLSPGHASEDAAFLSLNAAVRQCGPYGNPRFDDPAIATAVRQLGGWAAVNEQLPAPTAVHDFEAFKRRFAAAYEVARAQHAIQGKPSHRLLGLHALASSSRPDQALGHQHDSDRCIAQVAGARQC